MGSLNKHIIVGTVGKDPVLRVTQSGKSVCEISIATNDGDKDNQGNPLTNWHKVICFDKTAEFVSRNVAKGTIVCAEGPVKLRSFDGKEGHKVYIKETIAFKVELITKSVKNDNPASYKEGAPPMQAEQFDNIGQLFPGSNGTGATDVQNNTTVAGEEHTYQSPPYGPEDDLPF